jgi:hypothetical protein
MSEDMARAMRDRAAAHGWTATVRALLPRWRLLDDPLQSDGSDELMASGRREAQISVAKRPMIERTVGEHVTEITDAGPLCAGRTEQRGRLEIADRRRDTRRTDDLRRLRIGRC